MRTVRAVSLTLLAAFLPASALHAQPAKLPSKTLPSAAPAAPAAPSNDDIVRLKSGASFRGALVEHDPKGRTLLQTTEGTRDFDSNDVAYAGPAAGDTGPGGTAPPPPPATSATTIAPLASTTATPPLPTPPVAASSAAPAVSAAPAATGDAVQLNANAPGVQFHVLRGPIAPRVLCAAPCSTQLPVGTYRMALSKGFDPPQTVAGDVEVRANGTLDATYANNKGARFGGVLLIVGGSIVGVAGLAGIAGSGTDSKALGSLGLLAGAAGVTGGILLVRRRDEASIRSAEADRVAPRTGFVSAPAAPTYGGSLGGRF